MMLRIKKIDPENLVSYLMNVRLCIQLTVRSHLMKQLIVFSQSFFLKEV